MESSSRRARDYLAVIVRQRSGRITLVQNHVSEHVPRIGDAPVAAGRSASVGQRSQRLVGVRLLASIPRTPSGEADGGGVQGMVGSATLTARSAQPADSYPIRRWTNSGSDVTSRSMVSTSESAMTCSNAVRRLS